MFADKVIDRSIPVPMYYQLKKIILDLIHDGMLGVDDMIPTEKELSEMFQLSRTTVRQAIMELTQEGYLYRIKSKGTFVSRPKDNQSFIMRLESFDDHIRRLGKKPRTEILSCNVVPMPANVAAVMRCAPKSNAIELLRLRFADNEPVTLTHTYLPYDRCSHLLTENRDLTQMYASMAAQEDTHIVKVVQIMEAVLADTRDAEYLRIRKGAPIQLLNIIGYNRNDVPLEFTYSRFRGDRHKFQCQMLVDEE